MELKELYPEISELVIELTANPNSQFSQSYNRRFSLLPDDELKVVAECPNGSCTNKVVVFTQTEIQEAIGRTLHSDMVFTLEKSCEGWEDKERIGRYHCNSRFTLTAHILTGQRNHGV